MKNLIIVLTITLVILNVTPVAKSATTVDLLGDKDGFGVGCPIGNGLHFLDYGMYWEDYRMTGDPAFTDNWDAGDRTWTHTYDLMGIAPVSASLEIYVAGLADYPGWSADVIVNSVNVGTIPAYYSAHDLTRILTFNIPTYLLTESDDMTIGLSIEDDGFIIDYSQLTINTVPAPAAIALCGFGTAILSWLKRRKTI
jgi:hypothetical protein